MAEYIMQEMTLSDDSGKKVLFPRMKIWGQTDLDSLANEICIETTFSPAEITGVVKVLTRAIAREMAEGHSVKIEGLGVFTPSLGLREGFEREDGSGQKRNVRSIHIRDINFRADKEFIDTTARRCRLKRSRLKFRRSSTRYTAEQRLKLAQDYLDGHPFMRVADYCQLTGLLHNAAAKELKQWAQTPGTGIHASGRESHKVYVK